MYIFVLLNFVEFGLWEGFDLICVCYCCCFCCFLVSGFGNEVESREYMFYLLFCCVMQVEGCLSLLWGIDVYYVGFVVEGFLMCLSLVMVCCLCCFNIDEMVGS